MALTTPSPPPTVLPARPTARARRWPAARVAAAALVALAAWLAPAAAGAALFTDSTMLADAGPVLDGAGPSAAPILARQVLAGGLPAVAAVPSVFGSELFSQRVGDAVGQLRKALDTSRGLLCRSYFTERGIDLEDWLDLYGPPYIKEVSLPRPRGLCARPQQAPPFQWVFVVRQCTEPSDACALGSLLLHELGHLARRDRYDNEPPAFFARCRLSACIDAGRYR